MFRRKKKIVLTDTTCQTINNLTQAVEVLTGLPTRLKRLDFNTGRGQLFVGGTPRDITLGSFDKDRIVFTFLQKIFKEENELNWYIALFEEKGKVKIIKPQIFL